MLLIVSLRLKSINMSWTGLFSWTVFLLVFLTSPTRGTPDHFGTSTFTSVPSYNPPNALCATDPPGRTIPADDLGKCSWNCIAMKLCENFNFHPANKQCDIYFDKPKKLTADQPSCTHYQVYRYVITCIIGISCEFIGITFCTLEAVSIS